MIKTPKGKYMKTLNSNSRKRIIWNGKTLVWAGDGKTFLRGVGENFLTHPFFEEAFNKILKEYKPKKYYRLCLFLPCAYGKPYSQSYIHYHLIRALRQLGKSYEDIHQVILTNAGVVPRELEEHYPFCCYDWNPLFENSEIKERYSQVLFERLIGYITTFKKFYDAFACYLRLNSDGYRSIKMVEKELGIRMPNLSLNSGQIQKNEISEKALDTYACEEDLLLITSSNLQNLVIKIKEILR